jgi:cytochrome o ubiquinol oxidase subunit 2
MCVDSIHPMNPTLTVFFRRLRALLGAPAIALLSGCGAVLMAPAGDVALQQRNLILIATFLMLLIIVPVIVLTLLFAWRYRKAAPRDDYDPEWHHSTQLELVIWAAPLLIIIVLGAVTWISTHKLDPYRPLSRIDATRPVPADVKPLVVDVVALDWKWLFIYPEQGIALVNEVAAPVDRPIEFRITASTVMNSFFIPTLAGQIYAMPSMQTTLHAVINKPGNYEGMSSNYSGAGFSGMRFTFKGLAPADFDSWVGQTRASATRLDAPAYLKLEQPSERDPVQRFGSVDPELFDSVLNRCVADQSQCMKKMHEMMASHK